MRRFLPFILVSLLGLTTVFVAPAQALTTKRYWFGDHYDGIAVGVLTAPWTSNFAIAEDGDILTAVTEFSNVLRINRSWDRPGDFPLSTFPAPGWVDLIDGVSGPSTFPNIPGNARIVDDGDGGVIVSYKALNSGPPMMYVQRVLADGSKAWGVNGLLLASDTSQWEQGGSLVADGAGGAYVMWHSSVVIRMQHIDAGGNKLWGTEGVSLSTTGTYVNNTPEITQIGEADFIVTWADTIEDAVMAQRINGDGEVQWTAGGVEVVAINDVIDIELTVVPDNLGGVYITTNQGKIARVAADGSLPWGSSQRDYDVEYVFNSLVFTGGNAGSHGKNNQVIADSDGNAYMYGRDDDDFVAIQKISPAGDNVWSPSVKSYPSAPHVAYTINGDFNSDDRFTLFWNNSNDDLQYAQMFDTDGNEVLATPVEIGDSLNTSSTINKVVGRSPTISIFSYTDNFGANLDFVMMQKMSLLFQIANLPAGLEAEDISGNNIEVGSEDGLTESSSTVRIRDSSTGYLLAEIPVDMTQDRDWSDFSLTFDPDTNKIVTSGIEDLPGYIEEEPYTIFVKKEPSDTVVLLCPGASSVEDVQGSCAEGEELHENNDGAWFLNIGGVEYWEIRDLTGDYGFAPGLTLTEPEEPSENNASSSRSSRSKSKKKSNRCESSTPVGVPDLFQIDREGSTAKLHFTPVSNNVKTYSVIFGYNEGDERFGGLSMAVMNENDGVQSLMIDNLDPRANYAFKVIPVNGCATGEWSNWLTARPSAGRLTLFYRYMPGFVQNML